MTEMRRPSPKSTSLAALVASLVVLLVCGGAIASAAEPPAAPKGKSDGPGKAAPKQEQKPPKKKKMRPLKQRPTYWGAWIGTQLTGGQPPWDMSSVGRFSELAAKTPSLLEFAAPFADCSHTPCSFYRFPRFEMETIRNFGAIPFFSWGTQSTPVPSDLNLPDFQLVDLAAGTYDGYIREFAEGARDWGHPFFLRFNWEMNGNWFPWGEYANGNEPGDFVPAWQRVHDIFTAVGATNATWVWCPYAHAGKQPYGPLARYYPGDAYVDWTCLDGFNWAKNGVNPQPWRSFDEIFSSSYRAITQRIAPTKPMLLAEMASGGGPRAKSDWIDEMFVQLRTKYRRIRGLIWFEQIDRGVQWPIESSGATTKAFRRGIRQPGFRINYYYGLAGSPIGPPR
jgi:mannan endo-1,4-beta-mannosidase